MARLFRWISEEYLSTVSDQIKESKDEHLYWTNNRINAWSIDQIESLLWATEWALITVNLIKIQTILKDFNILFCVYYLAYMIGYWFYYAKIPQRNRICIVGVTEPGEN